MYSYCPSKCFCFTIFWEAMLFQSLTIADQQNITCMGQPKRKRVFEHVQNAQIQIILRMRKVPTGPLLSIHTFLADSEGPDQTARMRSLIWAFAVRKCPKTRFRV